jgi:DNA polymerase III alpha subunit
MIVFTWDKIEKTAKLALQKKGLATNSLYQDRLELELAEVVKQGQENYWVGLVNERKKFGSNPNRLLLPYVLGMVAEDPIAGREDEIVTTVRHSFISDYIATHGKSPAGIIEDSDKPDIDIDCLPYARDEIKQYAAEKYGKMIADAAPFYGVVEDDDSTAIEALKSMTGAVCSVGTWQTYLFRSAIIDVAWATGVCPKSEAMAVTKSLPDEVDEIKEGGYGICKGRVSDGNGGEKQCGFKHNKVECPNEECRSEDTETPTIGRLQHEQPDFAAFCQKYPQLIQRALRLVGRIRAMGKHAGALIIADRPLYGNIPMALDIKTGQWKSFWTEGRSPQLSKFGFLKWDLLGLKNLQYIHECCKKIEANHGITFGKNMIGLQMADPTMPVEGYDTPGRFGYYWTRHGEQIEISLHDRRALDLANIGQTDAVFQFDTDLAKSILANQSQTFFDLMIFNAMGHPGPMAMIPDFVARRDGEDIGWAEREPPEIVELLGETFGTIVYQEQLQTLWRQIAKFTATEAQESRKAVAKKWRDKLKPVEAKWMAGASKLWGEEMAAIWWDKMQTFGRYAFNKSHSVAYCLVAYTCLWLKAYFPQEWWASVMSHCNQDKLVRYMNVARGEGIIFSPMDATALAVDFAAVPDSPRTRHDEEPNGVVMPGLISLKKVGAKVAPAYRKTVLSTKIEDKQRATPAWSPDQITIDDYVEMLGKNKTVMERLIKLGAFRTLKGHENSKALWMWYQYMYCGGTEATELRAKIRTKLLDNDGWDQASIEHERMRQINDYRAIYPKRKKIPVKLEKWMPKIEDGREEVMALFPEDFSLEELLAFEEEFLGYHLHSPVDLFMTRGGATIEDAKTEGRLECVIVDTSEGMSKNNKIYLRVQVTDGRQTATIFIWENEYRRHDKVTFKRGNGISCVVDWNGDRKSFALCRNTTMIRMKKRKIPKASEIETALI